MKVNHPMSGICALKGNQIKAALAVLVFSIAFVSASPAAGPTSAPEGVYEVQKIPDLRFCETSAECRESAGTCDVYLPRKMPDEGDAGEGDAGRERWPVVLVVHGGAWATGDKWTMSRHAFRLAGSGFAAVAINYRLAPSSKFPSQVDDLRSALVWISEHADRYGFDCERVGLFGYSAGGHLVSLVGTLADEPWECVRETTRWAQDDGRWRRLPDIRAVCAGGPPSDFRDVPPDSSLFAYFLGGSKRELPALYRAASPVCHASSQDPPIEIVHGEEDGLVSIEHSRTFHRRLLESDVEATLRTVPRQGHLYVFVSPELSDAMVNFFSAHLKP